MTLDRDDYSHIEKPSQLRWQGGRELLNKSNACTPHISCGSRATQDTSAPAYDQARYLDHFVSLRVTSPNLEKG